MKKKRWLSLSLIFALLIAMVPIGLSFPKNADADALNASITPVYDSTAHRYFAVGFMSYEVWSKNDGSWDPSGFQPGSTLPDNAMTYTYSFSFPGRSVRDVKVWNFDKTNTREKQYFSDSRAGDDYSTYDKWVGKSTNEPTKSNISPYGTSTISFKVTMGGLMTANEPYNVVEREPDLYPTIHAPQKIYRYLFPVVFEFQLDGVLDVHHFDMNGNNIDSSFPDQSKNMTQGQTYSIVPATNAAYTYKGWKKSTLSSPSGGSPTSGNPESFMYDGTYDKYYLNLYYDAASNDGTAAIKHFDENGNSLTSIPGLENKEVPLIEGKSFNPVHDTNASYIYLGYKKSTTTSIPSGSILPGEYSIPTYAGGYDVQLNYYYKLDTSNVAGNVHIRHMTKIGSAGAYSQAAENTIPIASLPNDSTYSGDSQYGTIVSSNLSYVSYVNTLTVKTAQSVHLTSTTKDAFITFYYQKNVDFTGDFDITPSKLPFKDPFKFHPKDFVLNGCTYQYHYYKIEKDGITWTSPNVYGQTSDTSFTFSTYPKLLGVGIQYVSMKIVTSCGTSDWIGPKPLEMTGPSNNNPPIFEIGFVDEATPMVALHKVIVGTKLNLVYINNPSIPTPRDPDGDNIYFNGFDYSTGTNFVQSIASKSDQYGDGQHNLIMDTIGTHSICGTMRDEYGATAKACTYIDVVPKNPVPVITCPPSVIANHPIANSAFDASGSYSPSGLNINHSRDEWGNKQTSYANDTGSDITVQISLDVYDSDGLKSLQPATCSIIVKPDLPPIAKLDVPALSIRGVQLDILNKSTSPDGDTLVTAEYKYKYDANNNGFADDAWIASTGTMAKMQITPTKVGKYYFFIKVTEQYGMWDDTLSDSVTSLTLNVVNNAPEVSFDMEGKNPNPDLTPKVTIPAAKMLSDWALYETDSSIAIPNRKQLWSVQTGALTAGSGATFHAQQQYFDISRDDSTGRWYYDRSLFSDQGYGANGMTPWRAIAGPATVGELGVPSAMGQTYKEFAPDWDNTYYGNTLVPSIKANKKYIYILANSEVWALNKTKIKQANPYDWHIGDRNTKNIGWMELSDRTIYVWLSSGLLVSYDALTGQLLASKSDVYYNFDNIRTTVNDNLTVMRSNSSGDRKITKYDRNLNVIKEITAPQIAKPTVAECQPQGVISTYSQFFAGENGEFYFYNHYELDGSKCYVSNYAQTKIYRMNADLGVDWETQVEGYPRQSYSGYAYGRFSKLIFDPLRNDLYAQTFNGMYNRYLLDSNTGAIKSLDKDYFSASNVPTPIGWNGNDPSINALFHPDLYTTQLNGYTSNKVAVRNPSGTIINDFGYKLLNSNGWTVLDGYFGDGIFLQVNYNDDWMSTPREYMNLSYAVGTPSTNQLNGPIQPFHLGQFSSPDEQDNTEFSYTFRMPYANEDTDLTGFSFRMTNPAYRYAVETDGQKLYLSKYVTGVRTVIASQTYSFQNDTSYSFKIKAVGDSLKVWMNGIPFFDATDGTYTKGHYGYMANKAYVAFSSLTLKPLADNEVWSNQYAIWDTGTAKAEIKYNNIIFEDPENDPVAGGLYDWTVNHTVRFIHNQGVSALNGQTFHNAQLNFDKVGDYTVKLKAKDDPNPSYLYPDNTFDEYRKSSNEFTNKITVHRRPLLISPSSKAGWESAMDGSQSDPDRY